MDWTLVIDRNRDALLRLLAMWIAAVGIVSGGVVARLPRSVRLTVLRELRPGESALRRLIVILARDMVVTLRGKRAAPTKPIPRGTGTRAAVFPLFDPRKRFVIGADAKPALRYAAGPRMSVFGYDEPVFAPATPKPTPDDLVDARRLCNRLLAFKRALEDLPKQARRMARLQAKKRAAQADGKAKLVRSPMRPGRPPGHRARGSHEVDEILRDCHYLALSVREPPDTS